MSIRKNAEGRMEYFFHSDTRGYRNGRDDISVSFELLHYAAGKAQSLAAMRAILIMECERKQSEALEIKAAAASVGGGI